MALNVAKLRTELADQLAAKGFVSNADILEATAIALIGHFDEKRYVVLRIAEFTVSLSGTNNNVDVENFADITNGRVGYKITGGADNQNCDISALIDVPGGIAGFDTNAIKIPFMASDSTGNTGVTVEVYDTNNTLDYVSPKGQSTAWTEIIIPAVNLIGTYEVGKKFQINIHVEVDLGDSVWLSDGVAAFSWAS